MKKNMGMTDRLIRLLVALGIATLYITGSISGLVGAVLGIVAVVLVLTGLTGFCPGYVPLGISTRREKSQSVHV